MSHSLNFWCSCAHPLKVSATPAASHMQHPLRERACLPAAGMCLPVRSLHRLVWKNREQTSVQEWRQQTSILARKRASTTSSRTWMRRSSSSIPFGVPRSHFWIEPRTSTVLRETIEPLFHRHQSLLSQGTNARLPLTDSPRVVE